MSPKRSATPETQNNSQRAGPTGAKTKVVINRTESFCTWCWTSGDILDTFLCFTVMLLTSLVDLAASLASKGAETKRGHSMKMDN